MAVEQTEQKTLEASDQPSLVKPPPLYTFSSSAEPRQRQIVAFLSLVTGMIWIFSVPAIMGQIMRSETTLKTRLVEFSAGDLFVGSLIGLPTDYTNEPLAIFALLTLSFAIEFIANPISLVIAMGYPFVLGIMLGSWYETKGSGFLYYGIDLWTRIAIPIWFMVSALVFPSNLTYSFTNNEEKRIGEFLTDKFIIFMLQAVFFFLAWIFLSFLFVMLFIFVPTSMGYKVGLWITQAVGEEV